MTEIRTTDLTDNFVLEDNETYIRRGGLVGIICPEVEKPQTEVWCQNTCGADEIYFTPFTRGDKLYFQWLMPVITKSPTSEILPDDAVWKDSVYTTDYLAVAELYNLDGTLISDVIEDFADTFGIGIKDMKGYQWLSLDTSLIAQDCFILKVELYNYLTRQWVEWWSDPFGVDTNTCEDVIEIEAVYPAYSQNGNYYGEFETSKYSQDQNDYQEKFKLHASFEKIGFDINNLLDENNNFAVKSNITETYRIRTEKIPPYIADKLATALAAKELYIEGTRLYFTGKITKTFDEGKSWTITAELTTFNNELIFGCT